MEDSAHDSLLPISSVRSDAPCQILNAAILRKASAVAAQALPLRSAGLPFCLHRRNSAAAKKAQGPNSARAGWVDSLNVGVGI
jgi:hypothetical protein